MQDTYMDVAVRKSLEHFSSNFRLDHRFGLPCPLASYTPSLAKKKATGCACGFFKNRFIKLLTNHDSQHTDNKRPALARNIAKGLK